MKLFVACSASRDIPNEYFTDCSNFLTKLMKDNDLVFGACKSGLMELVYDITKENKNKVIGICPDIYKHDFKELECDVEIITENISERTNNLIKESDALIFLPGGIGTINELFTAIELKRCHEFDKPIVIYNLNGFYDKLLVFLEKLYNEKFARIIDKDLYLVSDNLESILNYINNYSVKN